MFKYIHHKMTIRLSELHTQPVTVPAWEVPLVHAIHGEAAQDTGERVEVLTIRAREADDEFNRLANRYRGAEVGAPPYVAAVYGSFGPGVKALAEAIEKARVKEAPPVAGDEDFSSLLGETA
jgi:hypothetical protein